MWEVSNRTQFAVAGYFARDHDGLESWAVAVRAHFDLAPGQLPCLAEQAPVRLVPQYAGTDAQELQAESQLSPFRPYADVVVSGSAVAPGEHEVYAQDLSLRIGLIEKRVRAIGPRRVWRHGGKWHGSRDRFTKFPLSWCRSLGGPDVVATDCPQRRHPVNPIGMGWSTAMPDAPDAAQFELPQLERPDALLRPDRPPPTPIGFGAIQPGWQPRLGRAGTHDEVWQSERAPLRPNDFSAAFHQAVSDDQIYPEELRGGEPVEMNGFHPEGILQFRLPQILLKARTRMGRSLIESRFRLIGVEIDATARTLDMVWNTAVPCPAGDHLVDHSVVLLQQMAGVSR